LNFKQELCYDFVIMPILKSAIKKMRQDRRKTEKRKKQLTVLREAIKTVKREKRADDLKKAVSLIDKAAKINLIHKNKAARLKSSLLKAVSKG